MNDNNSLIYHITENEEDKMSEEEILYKKIQELRDYMHYVKQSYGEKITILDEKIQKLQQDLNQINETDIQKQEELKKNIIQQIELKLSLNKEKENILINSVKKIRQLEIEIDIIRKFTIPTIHIRDRYFPATPYSGYSIVDGLKSI